MLMRSRPLLPLLLLLAAPVAAQTAAPAAPAAPPATKPAPAIPPADVGNNPADPMLGGKDLGKSIACISTVQIRKTRIINESVIMFQVGNRWYRNDLNPACTGMTSRMTIIDRPHGTLLCEGNIIDFVKPGPAIGMGTHQGSCMYGRFTPYMPPPPPAS